MQNLLLRVVLICKAWPCEDLLHALWLHSAGSHSSGDVDEQGLVGSGEQADQWRDATALSDGGTVDGSLSALC